MMRRWTAAELERAREFYDSVWRWVEEWSGVNDRRRALYGRLEPWGA